MRGFLRKVFTFFTALTLMFGFITTPIVPAVPVNAATPLYTVECENAELTSDLKVTTKIYEEAKPGYSGSGFVWMQSSGTLTFNVTVPETGMYMVSTRYMQELSTDGRLQYLYVDGVEKGSYMLPYTTEWSDFNFGIQKLTKGSNTIQIKSGWGYAYFDTLTVDYPNLPSLETQPTLSDSQATEETQTLMNYLTQVYGHNIISGQQEIYGGGNDGKPDLEFDWIYNLTGKYPAIRGFDFMNYNPLYGWEDGTTNRVIDWVNTKNGIAAGCWHIHVPKDFDSYELGSSVDWKQCTYKPTETNFNTANAVIPGTKEYQYLMLAIDDLAQQLLILQNNNVPIIFRPFHEAEGNGGENGEGAWFWWGSAGADVYKQLWNLLYTQLTQTYGLHNIIWNYNSYNYSTSPSWYPGNDQVDIVGYDKYNTVYNRHDGLTGGPNEDAITSIFYQLVDLTGGKKMVAMAENDTIPSVQNLIDEKAGWLYFCPWYGDYIMSSSNNNPTTLTALYQSDYVITLDELPDLKGGDKTPSASITPTNIEFDKYAPNQSDKAITINFNGNTLDSIKTNTATLKENTDYTLSGTDLIIKKAFLSQLSVGDTNIILDFDKGNNAVLKVKVIDSTPSAVITPVSAAFDKATDKQQNVTVSIALNDHQLTSITNGTTALVSGTDYVLSDSTVVLQKSYLSSLPLGNNRITFHFDSGNNSVLTVNVVDTTPGTGNLVIQSYNGNTSTSTNGLAPRFKIQNTGSSDINISDISIRYYYTIDGDISQNLWCDWSSIGSENVKGQFVKLTTPVTGADYYLELTFTAAASTLKPGQSAEVQARFTKSDWTNYTQSNDYSFDATSTQYSSFTNVTGYLDNKLIWGVEPK